MGGKKGGGLGGIVNGAKDLVLGKKDPGVADRFVALDPLQQKALGKYGEMLNFNTDNLASHAVTNQENLIRANAGDVERNAQKLVAQRGLGNSSVGLNAITGATRDLGDKINAVRASLPSMQYDMKMNNLNSATNGLQNILNSRTFIQGTPGGTRKGGLAPLIGAGIGGYYGGAGGAQAGLGAGQAATQIL